MVRDQNTSQQCLGVLVVGNYYHDVLIRDSVVVGKTLGSVTAFISAVLNGISILYNLVSKVGPDFAYTTCRSPIVIPTSRTTLFHAHFDSNIYGNGNGDRVLKQVAVCNPIHALDLDGFGRRWERRVHGKMCCVVVTHGKEGCNVYWKDGE